MNIINYHRYSDDAIDFGHAVKTDQREGDYLPHAHDISELIFFKQGNVSYTVDGRQYRLNRNDLVISRPFDIHCIHIDGESDYERYDILFDEKTLPFDIYAKIPRKLDVISFDGNQTVIQLFDKMDYYCSVLTGDALRHVLINLVEEVFINIMIEAKPSGEDSYTPTNSLVCAAVAYIEEHLLTLTGIEEICRELYITKSHLHHLFIRHLRISPKKFVTAKRLALAQREIAAGGKPTEVCLRCGFTDYSAFYRAYRAQFGHSPSERVQAERAVITSDNTPKRQYM